MSHMQSHKNRNCNSVFIFIFLNLTYITHIAHTYLLYKSLYKNPSNLISQKGRGTYCIWFLVLLCLNTFKFRFQRDNKSKAINFQRALCSHKFIIQVYFYWNNKPSVWMQSQAEWARMLRKAELSPRAVISLESASNVQVAGDDWFPTQHY